MITDQNLPGWSLCIATLNRRDALVRTLDFAARQTWPPRQIVVVDVSDEWEESRTEAQQILAPWPDIELIYVTSAIRSSATQRNAGIALCTQEIIFLLDDDSFLFPTAAEEALRIFAADTGKDVAGIAILMVPELPPMPDGSVIKNLSMPEQKMSGRNRAGNFYRTVMGTRAGRWFNRKVLLQSKEELFIKYDGSRLKDVPDTLAQFDVAAVAFITGGASAVRRSVAVAEPFDTALRFYAAFEDLDVAYRYARHGALLKAHNAHLHHYEAAGGRLQRKKLVIFQLLNSLVFLKRYASDPKQFLPVYRRLLWRRLFGEALKDLLSRRFDFPQARGVWTVIRTWRSVWARDTATIDDWYPAIQKNIIDDLK
jgi:GT2 family glycosyltransferase